MDDSLHLSVLLDCSPSNWHQSALLASDPLSFHAFLPILGTFLNAHLAQKQENTLSLIGAFPGKSTILFSSETDSITYASADQSSYQPFSSATKYILERLKTEFDALPQEEEAPIALVGALTKSLCHINKLVHPPPPSNPSTAPPIPPTPRILILSVSPDLSASYIPIMNSIFSSQKLKVTIDVCNIHGSDTVFLQQASHLTGGSYISLKQRDALLHFFFTCFLAPPAVRRMMVVPTEDKVDFRAACFCHKKIVDIGFVCAVCLSIFCSPTPICTTCRAKFPMKSLKRLKEMFSPSLPADPKAAARTPSGTPTPGTPRPGTPKSSTPVPGSLKPRTSGVNGLPHPLSRSSSQRPPHPSG